MKEPLLNIYFAQHSDLVFGMNIMVFAEQILPKKFRLCLAQA